MNFRLETARSIFDGDLASYVRQEYLRKKKERPGLVSAFFPGLLTNVQGSNDARVKLSALYKKVLIESGFKHGTYQSTHPRIHGTWRIWTPVSYEFEIEITLIENQGLIKVTEKPLNWIHHIFVSGKKQIFKNSIHINPDMKIAITFRQMVEKGTDLYRQLLKVSGKEMSILPITIEDAKSRLACENSRVSNVRHVEFHENYSNGKSIDASITYGTKFSMGFEVQRPFCELSLYADPSDLHDLIKNSLQEDYVDKFTRNVFYISLKIKQKLEEVLNKEGRTEHQVICLCFSF